LITDVCYVVRVDDLELAPGQTKLFSRVFYGWHGQFYSEYHKDYGDDISPAFAYKFQQYLSPDENLNQLSAYENAILGSTSMDRLIVSAQTTTTVDGQTIPSFKYSIDGGNTWKTVDLSNVKVADGENLPAYQGVFLDDNYVRSVWVSGSCDNYRYVIPGDGTQIQCQSYEMDVLMERGERDVDIEDSLDAIIEKDGEKENSVDAIVAKDIPKPYDVDGLLEGEGSKTYRVDRTLEGESTKEEEIDAILSIDQEETDSVDAIFEKNIRLIYKVGVGLHDKNSRLYLVDTKLVKDDLNKRLARVRRTFPQVFDLWLPEIPQGVYNSVWEIIE